MTETAVQNVIQAAIQCGVRDFCICPGGRNPPLIALLKLLPEIKTYYFYDERSAAFFALGRSQAGFPAAIITTSGTAISYLLGAAMESYYTGTPLLLITADRPRSYRGSNAPQSCEQHGIYGHYTKISLDIAENESCDLSEWDRSSPAHINICLEEPNPAEFPTETSISLETQESIAIDPPIDYSTLKQFFDRVQNPLVIVGRLKPYAREAVIQFLLQLNAPIYLEAISGLRENPRLESLRITRHSKLWEKSEESGYPIDGILRIGGIPTFRLWRDLENKKETIAVYSINDVPFSGLSWGPIECAPLDQFFQECPLKKSYASNSSKWLKDDRSYHEKLQGLFSEEPSAEPSLIHFLSKAIPKKSLVYLGNSLPIREWDMAATRDERHYRMHATRGLNGIDGQTSTFLGLSQPHSNNWALVGDLTALHDLAAPWILPQMNDILVNIAIVNNGGGKIFEKMFPQKEIQNCHDIKFEPFAKLWNLSYELWEKIPEKINGEVNRLIEIKPNEHSSRRFWEKLNRI